MTYADRQARRQRRGAALKASKKGARAATRLTMAAEKLHGDAVKSMKEDFTPRELARCGKLGARPDTWLKLALWGVRFWLSRPRTRQAWRRLNVATRQLVEVQVESPYTKRARAEAEVRRLKRLAGVGWSETVDWRDAEKDGTCSECGFDGRLLDGDGYWRVGYGWTRRSKKPLHPRGVCVKCARELVEEAREPNLEERKEKERARLPEWKRPPQAVAA